MNQPVKYGKCRSCGAPIVWMKTKRGKNIPIDPDSIDEAELEWEPPSNTNRDWAPKFQYGTHSVHFETCPERQEDHKPPSQPQSSMPIDDDEVPF